MRTSVTRTALVVAVGCSLSVVLVGQGVSPELGMVNQMAEALGGSVTVEGLQPFVEPSLCVATLST